MTDRLKRMFKQQKSFIKLLEEKRGHPAAPLDLTDKKNQQFLKHLSHECMNELYESIAHLKNTKIHRATNLPDFNREEYKEELSDVLHYLIGIMIYSGIDYEEIFEMYMKKGEVNVKRIETGY